MTDADKRMNPLHLGDPADWLAVWLSGNALASINVIIIIIIMPFV